jgi:hypothetical protein
VNREPHENQLFLKFPMTAEKRQFLDLVRDYQDAVARAVAMLNAKSEREKCFQMHRNEAGGYAGYLDAKCQVRYEFHGAGCYVTLPEVAVDFDFGIDSR